MGRRKMVPKINYMAEAQQQKAPDRFDPFAGVDIQLSPLNREAIRTVAQVLMNNVLQGASRSDLFAFIMTRFSVSAPVAQSVLDDLFTIVREDVMSEIEHEGDLAVARRMHLYRKALQEGDVRTALLILQDKDKLRGMYAQDGAEKTADQLEKLVDAMLTAATNCAGSIEFDPAEIVEGEMLAEEFAPETTFVDDEEED